MVIDALVSRLTEGRQTYDRDGRIARRAQVHDRMLASMMADPYFKLRPPKTTGREQFGQEFASGLAATGLPLETLIATATEFSVGITGDPWDITAGPDGNVWFTEYNRNRVGRITPAGIVTEFAATTNSYPDSITAGFGMPPP